MDPKKTLVLIDGVDKTESISSCVFLNNKCTITYLSGKSYHYNAHNIEEMPLVNNISTEDYYISKNEHIQTNINEILDFGDYIKIGVVS